MRSAESYLAKINTLLAGQPPRAVLQRALKIIEDPSRWHYFTQDAAGNVVRPNDLSAVRWCLEGAIARECNPYGILPPYFMVLLDTTLEEEFGFSWDLPYFEQHHDHAGVVSLLKLAILRAPDV
jgi:hypothetical protein